MAGPAGEELAQQLRALKERSGRSYGALAARLHVASSTLHRYVNGDAVPADYASVERLARLCGAKDEELIELQRLWLRADAHRRGTPREKEKDTPLPAEPAAETPPPAGWWAGRRGALIWPVALALAVVLSLAATAMNGDPGEESPPGGELAAPGKESASPSRTPGGQSPAKSGAPAAEGKGKGGGGKSGAQSGPSSPAPRKGASAKLAWSTRSHVWDYNCGHRYLINKDPAEVPPPPAHQDAQGWAESQQAVHGGNMIVEVTLEPKGDAPVVIEAVHVRIAGRSAPLEWSAFDMSDGCGGALTEAGYAVNLDAPRPLARPQDGFDGEKTIKAADLPYQVAPDDPLALRVQASTERYDARWYLEIEWSSGERTGLARIDDGGSPFRASSLKDRPAYGYSLESGSWAK